MNYVPDLSGVDWNYYATTYQRTIFRAAQKLKFDIPVFLNERFEVSILGSGTLVLVPNTDWVAQGDDIDYDAMSVCKSIDPTFDKTLLKSITIIRLYSSEYSVQVKFNQLMADYINYARINKDQTIEVTPTLVGNMLEQITYLQQMVLNPSGLYSPQSSVIKILDEDPSGLDANHMVVDETHDIDTINGLFYIRPSYGAFFLDSVIIKNGLSGEVFVKDTDYAVIELDIVKTQNTSNVSGVYRTIRMLKAVVGEVKVSYQAYGGIVDIGSVRGLHNRVWAMEEYLSSSSYVTPATLPADPTIIVMRNKLQEIEGQMRLLLQNGLPTYGDVSTGSAVLKKVTAPDQLSHWWSIGSLYRVDGSSDNILADVFKFRLKSLLTGLMFEVAVAVNVTGANVPRISVSCDNSLVPKDTLNKYMPKLRILEVNNGGIYSGVVLQLGMKMPNILQETFDIEDMSGRESCWKLAPFDAASVPPEDTGVMMPGGQIWAAADAHSLSDVASIPFVGGSEIMLPETNIAVTVNGITTFDDMIIQTLDELDMGIVKSFQFSLVAEIASASPKEVTVNIPVMSCDKESQVYTGNGYVAINGLDYGIGFKLFYHELSTSLYTIELVVTRTNVVVNTLNLTGIKLLY